MSAEPFDHGALDQGIRDVVLTLRLYGFNTTDSGDGVSKPEMGCALEIPNVFMTTEPRMLVTECDRLRKVLEHFGITVVAITPEPGVYIQGSYDPLAGTAFIALYGLNNDLLWAGINAAQAVADAQKRAE